MTRYEVVLPPPAEAEIREAFLLYFERSPLAADAFRIEVFDAIERLETDVAMWPEDDECVRYHILRRFPYTVHYELDALAVTVLAVAHHRHGPGYWQARRRAAVGFFAVWRLR